MPLREFSFALIALASQFRAPARSGLTLFQPQPFAPKFPAQVDAASAIAFCLDALIYHSSALSRSGLQFCPPQCARAKISEPNGCRSRIATFTFQCGVSLPFPSDPVGPPSVRPFAHSICFLLRLRAEGSPFQACPRLSFSQRACRSAPGNQPLPWAQSPCLVRALSHIHGPHLSLGGSGLCSNLCSTCHRAALS